MKRISMVGDAFLLTMKEYCDTVSGGEWACVQYMSAQQGIEKSALARVKFAHDHNGKGRLGQ